MMMSTRDCLAIPKNKAKQIIRSRMSSNRYVSHLEDRKMSITMVIDHLSLGDIRLIILKYEPEEVLL